MEMSKTMDEKMDAKEITLSSYAKINLSLDVLGRREDGYHEVSMILQAIELHDDVTCSYRPPCGSTEACGEGSALSNVSAPCISIRVIQDEEDAKRDVIPEDERNIAWKAAALMMERFPSLSGDVEITIRKRVPAAAGLAGGSGNGAAVLLAMYHFLQEADPEAAASLSTDELLALGGKLGADVPFQMMVQMKKNEELGLSDQPSACTCALAEGTGTSLTPVRPLDSFIVLATPPAAVSTREVYEGIDRMEIKSRPDNRELAAALQRKDTKMVQKNMTNVLENYTLNVYDIVNKTKSEMSRACSGGVVLMSGSGPTVFAAVCSREKADEIYEIVSREHDICYLTRTIA